MFPSSAEADLGLLQHPRWSALLTIITKRPILDVGCCNSPRSTSVQNTVVIHKLDESISKKHFVTFCKFKERLVTFC